jgi:hypothetical protein
MAEQGVPDRRRALRAEVDRFAQAVVGAVREAYVLHLPVEPGVREGREALTRWAALLDEVLP